MSPIVQVYCSLIENKQTGTFQWARLLNQIDATTLSLSSRKTKHSPPSSITFRAEPQSLFFSQQQAFTDTDREIALVVPLSIASKIVSFKVGFKKPPSLTSYLCTHVWNRSQHIAFWPQCLVWNQKKLALCSIVKVFDLQTFSCVQLTNFWVSLIMFDYQTQSKSIEPLGLLEFDYQTFVWLHQAFCIFSCKKVNLFTHCLFHFV